MITPAQRAEIRRLYYGEHWKLGIIATQLGLHPETVRAAVERETAGVRPRVCRPSILDPYLPVIRDTLTQYPRLRATRIHEMLRQRGYAGSVFPVRKLVRHLRPETSRAVYRRVVTLPGDPAVRASLRRILPSSTKLATVIPTSEESGSRTGAGRAAQTDATGSPRSTG